MPNCSETVVKLHPTIVAEDEWCFGCNRSTLHKIALTATWPDGHTTPSGYFEWCQFCSDGDE